MPRLNTPCLLCEPNIDRETHDIVWRGMSEGGRIGAVKAAKSRNIDVDEKAIRRHFEYHRPRQAEPIKRMGQKESVEKIKRFSKRKQALIETAFRMGAINETIAAHLFYWNGDLAKQTSAIKAASRDLRALIDGDFLFRVYPENMPGKSIWLPDGLQPPVYTLGANGRFFAEEITGFSIKKDDFSVKPEDLKNWASVLKKIGNSLFLDALAQEIHSPTESLDHFRPGPISVGFSVNNFARGSLIKLKLKDPRKQISELKVDGVGAISFFDQNNKPFLFPFFYYYDDQRRKVDKLIKDIISSQTITKTGQVSDLFPDINNSQPIAVILITESKDRLEEIAKAARKHRQEILPDSVILATTKDDVKNPLSKTEWFELFANKKITKSLFEVALKSYQKRPIASRSLKIKGPRRNKNSGKQEVTR